MASTEEIVTRYVAEDQYSATVNKATAATMRFSTAAKTAQISIARGVGGGSAGGAGGAITGALNAATNAMASFGGSIAEVGAVASEVLPAVGIAIGAVAAAGAVLVKVGIEATQTFASLASHALDSYASMESVKLGLTALTGSAEEAERQFQRLRRLALLPGLGFQEVANASVMLQAANLDLEKTERLIAALGNAVTRGGEGKDAFMSAILQLSQTLSAGKLQGDELRIINEQVKGFGQVLKDAFGTSDTQAIAKMGLTIDQVFSRLITSLEKLPRATGGVRNTLDNLSDAMDQAWANAGEAVAKNFMPMIEKVSNMITNMANSGAFARIADAWSTIFGGGTQDFFIVTASYLFAVVEEVPKALMGAVRLVEMGIDRLKEGVTVILAGLRVVSPLLASGIDAALKYIERSFRGSPIVMITSAFFEQVQADAERFQRMANGSTSLTGTLIEGLKGLVDQQNRPLAAIEKHTKATADTLSRQEQLAQRILGGGSIGRMGVTPVELAAGLPRGRRTGGRSLEEAIRILTAAVYEEGHNAALDTLISRQRAFAR